MVRWNPRFLHLRGHYAFHATACTPATPREKGSVEGSGPLSEDRVLAGPAVRDRCASWTSVYADWRDRVAHRRRHATGRFIVAERLAEERAGAAAAAADRALTSRWAGTVAGADRRLPAPRRLLLPRPDRARASARRAALRPRPASGSCTAAKRSPATRAAIGRASGCRAPRMRPEPPPPPAPVLRSPVAIVPRRSWPTTPSSAHEPAKTKVGERLPYLLCDAEGAARSPSGSRRPPSGPARSSGPTSSSSRRCCEAEVFAREASGARHAHPLTPPSPPTRRWRTSTSPPSPRRSGRW